MTEQSGRERVLEDAQSRGVMIEFADRGPASSLEEAAANLGIEPREIVKTLVAKVRLTQTAQSHSYLVVLIRGDQQVDWAKLRRIAGVKKASMAAPDEGYQATGYRPGTITPFGAGAAVGEDLPIFADESIAGRVCMGAGEPDLNLFVDAADLLSAFNITRGDIAK
ncbi:aminoacyl-tRNA deacylase [Nesterenkonia natronophila]|uniref:YbaK/aminoacyl-tRNA synthetase-associated domain-containing protein n=1 Tax=Nesterenkonia natronophila TaxID=2174932 RepID=A0A3A4F4E9_9MICC|nr:YbaK/EbsC family protein [Nesterenkonia natronophila]RJN33232.1 hypothetical protein D3250_03400 [Nesterenkonia natronophila]